MRVLVFGSLNLDMVFQVDHFVRKGETLKAKSVAIHCGGKGSNQALAAARAGAPVFMAGCIGRDGDVLVEVLRNAGVRCDYIQKLHNTNTGQAIIQNDPSGDNCILLDPGANLWNEKTWIDEVLSNFEEGDFLVCQNEISNMDYLINQAAGKGLKVFYNPAPMVELIHSIDLAKIDTLIVNETECRDLLDMDQALPETMIEAFREKYPDTKLLLTLGHLGALYMDHDQLVQIPAYEVRPVDTTGAGDTFIGYFISSLTKEEPIGECLKKATAASALCVQKSGAADSVPSLNETLYFLENHPISTSNWEKSQS